MSDTPRVDAMCESRDEPKSGLIWADRARELERELASVTKERDELARGFANLDSESVYMKLVGERDRLRGALEFIARQNNSDGRLSACYQAAQEALKI